MTPDLWAGLAVGAGTGFAIGWLLARQRATHAPTDDRLATELRHQLDQREQELARSRENLTQTTSALATAEAQKQAAESILAEQRALHERTLQEARNSQDKALADLRETFKALSADALKQTHPEFLRLANETLGKFSEAAKGDLSQRQESIKTLVEPLKQQLEDYQKRLQQSETAQSSALGEVKKQLESLATESKSLANETQQFRMVLRSNQARGRWGEETLRRVVEAAGMSAHCDFVEQAQSGDAKPDLVVRLPGERVIIVDAKVPDLDVLNAVGTADETKRAEILAAHAAKLKATIKSLADRDYPSQFPNALDHVVLFVPAESLFSAALEGDHDLILWAANRKIMLATPASLIALLRSVSMSWQQDAQARNAQDIADAARELYARVVKFIDHFDTIRKSLDRANQAYNEAVGSYERMVRPSGERLKELGGGVVGKELLAGQLVEGTLRLPPGEAPGNRD